MPIEHTERPIQRLTWLFRFLGVVLSALSVVKLLEHGFEIGWSAPFGLVVDYYEMITRILLSWLEPYLGAVLNLLNGLFDVHIHLSSQWKYVFILMWITFATEIKSRFFEATRFLSSPPDGFRVTAAQWKRMRSFIWKNFCFLLLWETLVALFTACILGALPYGQPVSSINVTSYYVIVPLLAFAILHVGPHVSHAILHTPVNEWDRRQTPIIMLRATRAPITLAVLLVLLLVYWPSSFVFLDSTEPYNQRFLLLVVVIAGYSLGRIAFVRLAYITFRLFPKLYRPIFPASSSANTLAALFAAGLFIVSNAGLKLFGL